MFLTFDVERIFSSFCHAVRKTSAPSISHSAAMMGPQASAASKKPCCSFLMVSLLFSRQLGLLGEKAQAVNQVVVGSEVDTPVRDCNTGSGEGCSGIAGGIELLTGDSI